MRQRLWSTGLAVIVLAATAIPAAGSDSLPSTIAPEVAAAMSQIGAGEMLTVTVTLRARADLGRIGSLDKTKRAAAVVRALKATSEAAQRPTLALLDQLAGNGSLSAYEAFWITNAISVTATPAAIEEIAARPEVESVTIPPEIELTGAYSPASSEENIALVRAPEAWTRGLTGAGVVVASVDTGVYPHQDVVGSYRGGSNSWFDPYGQHASPYDADGHGTATMSVIVGRDAGGSAIGMAPDAQWIAAKIFDDAGHATVIAVHEAFQWILDPDGNPSTPDVPDVVNNSWTNSAPGCDIEFEQDLAALRAAGILPVFAAGNAGPSASSSRSPSNLPDAFSVGAVDNADSIYAGSSRGPSTCSGDTQFPDIVAPGVSVRSAVNSTTSYWYLSGTSLAAPHVTGALALILEAQPGLSASQQAAMLAAGAADLGPAGPDSTYGVGRLDVAASIDAEVPNQDPIAAFSMAKGRKGVWDFDATSSTDPDGTIVSYAWDFGDGATGSGATVSHKYSTSAVFTVVLTVTDDLGAQASTSQDLDLTGGGGGGKGGGGGGKGGGGKK